MKNLLKFIMKTVTKGFIFKVGVENPKYLHKLLGKIYNKEKYVVHIGTLKQALNHRLILKKYSSNRI